MLRSRVAFLGTALVLFALANPARAEERPDPGLPPGWQPVDPARLANDDHLLPPSGPPIPSREESFENPGGGASLARRLGPTAGGTDVEVGPGLRGQHVAIAGNGDIFVSCHVTGTGSDPDRTDIYRSRDDGQSFQFLHSLGNAGEDATVYEMIATRGSLSLLYVLYQARANDFSTPAAMRVESFDPLYPESGWTQRTLMQQSGFYPLGGDIADDSVAFDSYYLYATWRASDGNGDDIWFSRSTDFGNTWAAPYRIGELTTSDNLQYRNPHIAYGSGGVIHVAWEFTEILQDTFTDALRYRRATGYAGSEIASWGPGVVAVSSTADADNSNVVDIAAASDGNGVVLLSKRNYNVSDMETWVSTDAGATWPVSQRVPVDAYEYANLAYRPSTSEFILGGHFFTRFNPTTWVEQGYQTGTIGGSGVTWDAPTIYSDVDEQLFTGKAVDAWVDFSRDEAVALAWYGQTAPSGGHFDAAWLDGSTVPLVEPGFPHAFSGGVLSPPAIANVDADPYGEIVFTTTNTLHLVSHVGTAPGGWPVNVPDLDHFGAAAVGDLNGDGEVEIVIGNSKGYVFAYDRQSELLPGWPVYTGMDAPAYVSIGAVGPPYPRHVVVCAGTDLLVYSYRGEQVAPFWRFTNNLDFPAAIGDVDGDGEADMVTVKGSYVHRHALSSTGNLMFRNLAPKNINGPAALADLDRDGDLEILVPTAEGDVYAMHHDGSDVAGWPWSNPAGGAVLPLAVANLVGAMNPDVAILQYDGTARVLFQDGTPVSGWPETLTSNFGFLSSPIIAGVSSYPGQVVAQSFDGRAHAYQNLSAIPSGWPRPLSRNSILTPAAGDIDQDGRNEIAFLAGGLLTVIEVPGPEYNPGGPTYWNMYGHDAQRTSCLNCAEDVVTAVEPVQPRSRVSFAAPHPNPSPGATTFRFALPENAEVRLEVFDVRGRRVRSLGERQMGAGERTLAFDGRDDDGRRLAAGQYLARLVVDGPEGREVQTRKLLLTR